MPKVIFICIATCCLVMRLYLCTVWRLNFEETKCRGFHRFLQHPKYIYPQNIKIAQFYLYYLLILKNLFTKIPSKVIFDNPQNFIPLKISFHTVYKFNLCSTWLVDGTYAAVCLGNESKIQLTLDMTDNSMVFHVICFISFYKIIMLLALYIAYLLCKCFSFPLLLVKIIADSLNNLHFNDRKQCITYVCSQLCSSITLSTYLLFCCLTHEKRILQIPADKITIKHVTVLVYCDKHFK